VPQKITAHPFPLLGGEGVGKDENVG